MDSPRPSIDSAYSSLFTAGLLNSSTPRSSIDLSRSRPNTSRRTNPPTPPPKIIIPSHSSGSSGPSSFASTGASKPKTPSRKRRSTLVMNSPQAALKSPTRTEMRSREMHLHVQHHHFSRQQHDLQNLHPFSSAALQPHRSSRLFGAKSAVSDKVGVEKDSPTSPIAWPGFLKSVWTPPISRLRRRAVPLAAPSPPPSAPLPKPPVPSSPTKAVFKPSSPGKSCAKRPPLAPITIPEPPQKLKSFFVLDDGVDMDEAPDAAEAEDVDMF